ncbi:MAG: prepilin-type N-terminal cleavage/methylation domain-containing protein [Myxococcota bacterium]
MTRRGNEMTERSKQEEEARAANRRRRPLRRRRPKRGEAGVTLVEVMIVVVIMALIATAVGIAILPQLGKGKEGVAESNVSAIKQASLAYILDGNSGCPGIDDLIDAGELDEDSILNEEGRAADPWGNGYDIQCSGDNVVVTSAGEDGEFNTDDDISTRRARRADG